MFNDAKVKIVFKNGEGSIEANAENVVVVNTRQTSIKTTGALLDIVRDFAGNKIIVPWDSISYIEKVYARNGYDDGFMQFLAGKSETGGL